MHQAVAYAELVLAITGWAVAAYLYRRLHQERLCPVTGLPTRDVFVRRAKRMIRRKNAVVAFVDFDEFKRVNDTYGHEAGNIALRALATRMRRHFGQRALVARLSGDEFAVVASVAAQASVVAEELMAILDGLRRQVSAPVVVGTAGESVVITLSIGAVHLGALRGRRRDLPTALNRADGLMYLAKNSGRDRAVIHVATAEETHLMMDLGRQTRGWPRFGTSRAAPLNGTRDDVDVGSTPEDAT